MCAATIPVAAQLVSSDLDESQLPTEAQILTQHHIGLTKGALLAALRNHDPQIRAVAARRLLIEGAKDGIPEMVEALETERVEWVKLQLAIALARSSDVFGGRVAFDSLHLMCNTPSFEMGARLAATLSLLELDDLHSCPETVAEALQPNTELSSRLTALQTVANLKELSPSESVILRTLVLQCLHDRDPLVRQYASTTLLMMGDQSAIPELAEAVSRESEPNTRDWMSNSLHSLKEADDPDCASGKRHCGFVIRKHDEATDAMECKWALGYLLINSRVTSDLLRGLSGAPPYCPNDCLQPFRYCSENCSLSQPARASNTLRWAMTCLRSAY